MLFITGFIAAYKHTLSGHCTSELLRVTIIFTCACVYNVAILRKYCPLFPTVFKLEFVTKNVIS